MQDLIVGDGGVERVVPLVDSAVTARSVSER